VYCSKLTVKIRFFLKFRGLFFINIEFTRFVLNFFLVNKNLVNIVNRKTFVFLPKFIVMRETKTSLTILVDEETHVIEMKAKQSVLEAALKNDVDAPYSCQGGVCSTCIARITEGEATMANNQILTDSEIAEGLILTCQAHPTTSTISIDYDDV